MIVVDTSELMRPTQRKLHAAWWELQGQPVRSTITVARELAAEAAHVAEFGGESSAERLLRPAGAPAHAAARERAAPAGMVGRRVA